MKKMLLLILIAVWIGGCAAMFTDEHVDSDDTRKYPAGMVINGFTLPPEPDPKVNNATLLGVDTNHNGIRDDLERFIIVDEAKDKYYQRLWTAIVLEEMKRYNDFMREPTPRNKTRVILEMIDCHSYALDQLRPKGLKGEEEDDWDWEHGSRYNNYEMGEKYTDAIFNTPERKKYFYIMQEDTSYGPRDKNTTPCTQEILTLIEEAKGGS